ncbi:TNF receptor-associated factor 4, partial [Daphnia magna]
VYPESSSQKTIFSSVVYCIHRKEGCEWNGELRKLKAHLLSCSLDAIPCRMQCGQQVSRLAHDDHGRNFCPNRRQICDYCQVEFNGLQYDKIPNLFLLLSRRVCNTWNYRLMGAIKDAV